MEKHSEEEINPAEWVMLRRSVFEKIWNSLTLLERALIQEHVQDFKIKEVKPNGKKETKRVDGIANPGK